MTLRGKFSTWILVLMLGTTNGFVAGWAIDCLLLEWSYDYVYPASYCQHGGLRLGLLLGTIVAIPTVCGHRPLPSSRRVLCWMASALLATLIIAFAAASLSWGLAKWSGRSRSADHPQPLSRMAFCSSLVDGACYGAWISAAAWSLAAYRHRKLVSTGRGLEG